MWDPVFGDLRIEDDRHDSVYWVAVDEDMVFDERTATMLVAACEDPGGQPVVLRVPVVAAFGAAAASGVSVVRLDRIHEIREAS